MVGGGPSQVSCGLGATDNTRQTTKVRRTQMWMVSWKTLSSHPQLINTSVHGSGTRAVREVCIESTRLQIHAADGRLLLRRFTSQMYSYSVGVGLTNTRTRTRRRRQRLLLAPQRCTPDATAEARYSVPTEYLARYHARRHASRPPHHVLCPLPSFSVHGAAGHADQSRCREQKGTRPACPLPRTRSLSKRIRCRVPLCGCLAKRCEGRVLS